MTTPSRFFWYELVTTDTKSAADFYAEVVGWAPKPFPGGVDYTVLHIDDGRGAAGIMAVPEESRGMPPMWLGYLHAADVDATAAALKAAGGAVKKGPEDIPGVGRFAVATDPQGAPFMIMSPFGADQPAPAHGTPGTIGWRDLSTSDMQGAFDFYSGLFGWTKGDAIPMEGMDDYQLFHAGHPQMPEGGMMNNPMAGAPPAWHFYFYVPAIDAARERVVKAGGKINMEPMEVPGGEWALDAFDPQGARFGLVSPRR
jgi:predicted enzyme related to lactoylglutathione lyase